MGPVAICVLSASWEGELKVNEPRGNQDDCQVNKPHGVISIAVMPDPQTYWCYQLIFLIKEHLKTVWFKHTISLLWLFSDILLGDSCMQFYGYILIVLFNTIANNQNVKTS